MCQVFILICIFLPFQATEAVTSQKLVKLKDLFHIKERINGISRHDMQMTPKLKLSIYAFISLP